MTKNELADMIAQLKNRIDTEDVSDLGDFGKERQEHLDRMLKLQASLGDTITDEQNELGDELIATMYENY